MADHEDHAQDCIKKIALDQLRAGMYVHDINCPWWEHPYLTNRFAVPDQAIVDELRALGVRELYIDTSKGADVAHAPTRSQVDLDLRADIESLAREGEMPARRTDLEVERQRARRLHGEANLIVRGMLRDVRLGRQIEVEAVEPLVEQMVDSIFRNPDALLPLARLKQHDSYTFQHSVSVCALMIAFARGQDMDRDTIRQIGVGALLHDVGKAQVPDDILNKPAKLTDREFARMKSHVVISRLLLQETPGIGPVALEVAAQHHERYDGSGYPDGLRGAGIGLYGRMAAIVDVYDAISSERVYHKGMPAPAAMARLLEWSRYHFDPDLVRAFIKTVGIYPSGSLVRLESGRLAVVVEQNAERLLQPRVRVIYHAVHQRYLPPELLNLARGGCQDRIVGHEAYETWNIEPGIGQA